MIWLNSFQKTVTVTSEHVPFSLFQKMSLDYFPRLPPASFYGDGFVQLKATESSDHNTLRIRFRTSSTNGLLFLAAGQTVYILLELHAGRLQVGTSMARAHEHMYSSIHEHTHAHIWTHTRISVHAL